LFCFLIFFENVLLSVTVVDEQDDNRPLTEEELYEIRVNRPYIIDSLRISYTFLDHLPFLSQAHKDYINQYNLEYKKKRELLNIIQRGSFQNYKIFLKILREAGQVRLANVMDRGGGM